MEEGMGENGKEKTYKKKEKRALVPKLPYILVNTLSIFTS